MPYANSMVNSGCWGRSFWLLGAELSAVVFALQWGGAAEQKALLSPCWTVGVRCLFHSPVQKRFGGGAARSRDGARRGDPESAR